MRWLTWMLAVLAVVAMTGRGATAGEPDAAALAALIDRHLGTRLDTEGVRPAEQADDAEFLRRVYLDLHGVVPTAVQAARLLGDASIVPAHADGWDHFTETRESLARDFEYAGLGDRLVLLQPGVSTAL